MKIIEYFTTGDREYWLSKIKESNWGAAQFLYELLEKQEFFKLVGQDSRVLMLVDGDELIAFCTLAEKDDVQPTTLTPWIGWVYTFPEHRGHHYAGPLLDYAEKLARADGKTDVYISTNHQGLYEKYGYEFLEIAKDIGGEDTRVYVKHL